jgi:hypothetical protein
MRRARVAVIALIVVIGFGAECSGESGMTGREASPRKGWKVVFNEEFNRDALNKRVWRTCFWWAASTCSIESNRELQLYNRNDVLIRDGILRLRARKHRMVGWNGTIPLHVRDGHDRRAQVPAAARVHLQVRAG